MVTLLSFRMFVDLFLQLIQVVWNSSPAFQLSTSPSGLCYSWTSLSAASNLFPARLRITGNYTLMLAVKPVFHPFSLYCLNVATRMCKCRGLLCLHLALKNDRSFQHIRCKIPFKSCAKQCTWAFFLKKKNFKTFLYTYAMVAWLICTCKAAFIIFIFFVAYISSWNFYIY